MNYQLKLVTGPAQEPVSVAEAKLHLRETASEQDAVITRLIKAARMWAENFTARFLLEQTWDLLLPGSFPACGQSILEAGEIRIPRAPLKASGGIVHVKYLDTAGLQQTLVAGTDYVVGARSEPALVLPAYGKPWPSTRAAIDSLGNFPVEVRFIAGYGASTGSIPDSFRLAILLLVGHWYEHREEVSELTLQQAPQAAESLLWQERFFPW